MRIDNPISNNAIITGSFTGSFKGDGTNLTGVTAEWDGSHTGDANITGSLTVAGNILPATANAYDLGSEGQYFRSAYVSAATINLINTSTGVIEKSLSADSVVIQDELAASLPAGVVSGSAQVDITGTTGYSTLNDAVTLNTAKISFDAASSTKLDGIEEGAEVNVVTSVASKTGDVSLVKGDVGLGNVDNTSDANKPVSTAQQTALDGKVSTDSAQALGAAANVLTFAGNVLTLTRGDGSTDTINLSAYLDDTNLARVISGTYDSGNQELVFTRDDSSTFTIDASMFFDDTNLVTSVNAGSGISVNSTTGGVIVTNDAPNVTTNLSATANSTSLTINSSDGTNASIPAATGISWGAMTDEDKLKLLGIETNANNYVHPTYSGDDFSVDSGALTGASVISDIDINVTTDSLGHVVDANGTIATRTLTLADLGYTGATNANYITNNNQLTNGAGYTTYSANQTLNNNSNVHFEGLMVGQTTGATANTIRCIGDVVAYYSSDKQFKDNIVTLEGALDKVKAIRGVRFDWNDKQDVYEGHDIGVIAQEVEAVLPELVHYREHSDSKAVDYVKLTAVLIEAVKELSAKVDELSK